jgi:hypothetical protein
MASVAHDGERINMIHKGEQAVETVESWYEEPVA